MIRLCTDIVPYAPITNSYSNRPTQIFAAEVDTMGTQTSSIIIDVSMITSRLSYVGYINVSKLYFLCKVLIDDYFITGYENGH